MSFLLTIAVAVRALLRNKMRASLTVLGIVIGITSIVGIITGTYSSIYIASPVTMWLEELTGKAPPEKAAEAKSS